MAASLVASWTSGLLLGFWPVLWTFLLLLQLSNDIKLNPGPVRFPCSVCLKPVRTNQRALQCDACAFWCHCICCGVDGQQYVIYQNAEVFNWLYQKCTSDRGAINYLKSRTPLMKRTLMKSFLKYQNRFNFEI